MIGRTTTGNPQLDYILDGGLPRHSLNLIGGVPGSGKTILAQQICFANATAERPALYLSTYSEPQAKLLAYLQELTFANVERVGREVVYLSILDDGDPEPTRLVEFMVALIGEHRPSVLVVDSFKAIAELVPDRLQWRKLLFELASVFAAYDVTGLWVGEYEAEMRARLPEFAIVDGILELRRRQSGPRDERYLRVAKLRGSGFRGGEHAYTISSNGLDFFPRLVVPTLPMSAVSHTERLQTGIDGLDRMVEKGWLRGTSTLVMGPSGAGKTVVGLHFLRRGVEDGEPGLLVDFQESPRQLQRAVESFGWDAQALVGAGRLDVLYHSPVELQIDSIVQTILDRIDEHRVKRIVIDALGELRRCAMSSDRFSDYVYVLTQEFAHRGITAMMIMERDHEDWLDVSCLSDNTLMLGMELGENLRRTIRVTKTRGSDHDGSLHELAIRRDGITVV